MVRWDYMALAHDTDLVIERNPLDNELDDVLSKLMRDLDVSSALCTSELGGRRQLLSWAGGDPVPFLRSIRGVPAPRPNRCSQVSDTTGSPNAVGIGAWVAAPIMSEGGPVDGVLWAAAVTRRWFDYDELRHLTLLARRAAVVLRDRFVIGLDEPAGPLPSRVLAFS